MKPIRIAYLDGWRGLAILGVIIGHFVPLPMINAGRLGVELFFVLSGRLMAEILFVKEVPLKHFFPRRFSRIYPALFAFLVLVLVARLLLGKPLRVVDWLSAATFTSNYVSIWIPLDGWIEHTWSLCIEEHMYILLGILSLTLRGREISTKVVLIFAGAAIFIFNGVILSYFGGDYYKVYWRSDVRGASILLGAAFYLLVKIRPVSSAGLGGTVCLLSAVLGVLLQLQFVPDTVKYSVGTSFLALSMAYLPYAPEIVRSILSDKRVAVWGIGSYSLYLWQQPLSKLIEGRASFAETLPTRALLLAAVLMLAYLSYRAIELPARRWLNGAFERLSL